MFRLVQGVVFRISFYCVLGNVPGHDVDGGVEGLSLVVEEVQDDGVQKYSHLASLSSSSLSSS